MKGSELVVGYVHLLYYQCHKINLNFGGLYMDSSYWIKKHPINKKDNKCFQYAITVTLSQKISAKNKN